MGKQNDTLGLRVTKWSVASADAQTGWPGPGKPCLSDSHTQPVLSWGLPAVPFPQVSHGSNNQEQSLGQAHSAEATGPSQGVMGLGVK